MPLFHVIVLAVVQGLTEFLPISSTAHLYLTSWLLGWQTEALDFDIALIEELLPLPSRQPAYRDGRAHTEFLRNLLISAEGLKRALRDSWGASLPATDLPLDEMERLVKEKYLNPSWTYN